LTLTGAATVAQYQAALQSVTFSSTAVGLFARSIVYGVIDDGGLPGVALPVVVTVLPGVNLPPVVLPGGLVVTYQVGDAPVALAPSLSVLDGSAMLSSATVTVGLKTAGDVLSWTPPGDGSITSLLGYDSGTGTLTLTGAATVAQYQAALRSVTFSSTAVGLFARSIVYGVIDDGGLPGVALPVVVTVLPNGIPLVTSSLVGIQLPFINGNSPKILDPGVLIVDDSSTLTGATVTVGGLVLGSNDTLSFTSPTDSGISGIWDPASRTFTLSGEATVAEYQAALRSVSFFTSGGILGLNLGIRTVAFIVTDRGGLSSVSVPLTVLVV
jgi:hypothetical protein